MNNGYLIFPSAIPEDLCETALSELGETGIREWRSAASMEFFSWLVEFLSEQGIPTYDHAELFMFNRAQGEGMRWHEDSYGNNLGKGRLFAACYLTPTTGGGGALKALPGSHLGGWDSFRQSIGLTTQGLSKGEPGIAQIYPEVFTAHPDEVLLEVPERTVILCDERIIHAVAVNQSDKPRIMVLLWMWGNIDDYYANNLINS